jgi:hypothetical protein
MSNAAVRKPRKPKRGAKPPRRPRQPKVRRLLMQREHELQAAVATYLDVALPRPNATWTSIDKAAGRGRNGGLDKRGVKDGWPDVHILWRGRAIYIELKATDGELREAQIRVRYEIEAAGGWWHEARTVESVEALLRAHGMPLRASVSENWLP